ncbi:MAG: ATP-binding protein [bacterium]
MIERALLPTILERLRQTPAVALFGPRQVGKTTLAKQVQKRLNAVFFDLEDPRQLPAFDDPFALFKANPGRLIIIDEAQRRPELFPVLRVAIDEDRQPGRFLILGSAAPGRSRQSAESLAGRLSNLTLPPLSWPEIAVTVPLPELWLRGGFPRALLAPDMEASLTWRRDYLSCFFERDLRQLGFDLNPERMRRLFTMLAHLHGQPWNAAQLGRSLDVGIHTANRYLEALEHTYLVRRVQPYFTNLGKRLRKTPKVYLAEVGLLHAVLGISSHADLLLNPVAGFSWEGFVLQQMAAALPTAWEIAFWRTAGGAEIDFLLLQAGQPRIAIEAKLNTTAPRPRRGFHESCADLQVPNRWVVYPGDAVLPLAHDCELLPLPVLITRLQQLSVI